MTIGLTPSFSCAVHAGVRDDASSRGGLSRRSCICTAAVVYDGADEAQKGIDEISRRRDLRRRSFCGAFVVIVGTTTMVPCL